MYHDETNKNRQLPLNLLKHEVYQCQDLVISEKSYQRNHTHQCAKGFTFLLMNASKVFA